MAGKATGKGKERRGKGNGRRYDGRKGRKGWGICATAAPLLRLSFGLDGSALA